MPNQSAPTERWRQNQPWEWDERVLSFVLETLIFFSLSPEGRKLCAALLSCNWHGVLHTPWVTEFARHWELEKIFFYKQCVSPCQCRPRGNVKTLRLVTFSGLAEQQVLPLRRTCLFITSHDFDFFAQGISDRQTSDACICEPSAQCNCLSQLQIPLLLAPLLTDILVLRFWGALEMNRWRRWMFYTLSSPLNNINNRNKWADKYLYARASVRACMHVAVCVKPCFSAKVQCWMVRVKCQYFLGGAGAKFVYALAYPLHGDVQWYELDLKPADL